MIKVRRRGVEKILVDICEHAGRCLEGVVGGLETSIFGAVLDGCIAGQDSGDIENQRCLLKSQRVLRGRLLRKSIEPMVCKSSDAAEEKPCSVPSEENLDMSLVDRKPQVQKF